MWLMWKYRVKVEDYNGGEVDLGQTVKCLLKLGKEFGYYSVGNWET